MRSIFAAIRTLVLPYGARSGVRLLLDGVNGRIRAFDASDVVIGRMEPNSAGAMFVGSLSASGARAELVAGASAASLVLDPEDWTGHTIDGGFVQSFVDEGAGLTQMVAQSPTVDGGAAARLFLRGETTAGGVPAILLDGGTGGDLADLQLNLRSLGRALLDGGLFTSTANDSARAAGVATDMARTVALLAGRTYRVALNTQLTLGTAGASYGLDLLHDGTKVGRFDRIGAAVSVDTTQHVAASVDYTPAADDSSATLAFANGSGSGGTITAIGNVAGQPRTLAIYDMGRL